MIKNTWKYLQNTLVKNICVLSNFLFSLQIRNFRVQQILEKDKILNIQVIFYLTLGF